jgi:hypothetical protein
MSDEKFLKWLLEFLIGRISPLLQTIFVIFLVIKKSRNFMKSSASSPLARSGKSFSSNGMLFQPLEIKLRQGLASPLLVS